MRGDGGGNFMGGDGGGNMMGGDGGGFGGAQGGTVDGGTYTVGVGERGVNSIQQAACACFCVIPITIMLIFTNELNLVKSDATAALVQKASIVEGCNPSDPYNGRMVYTSCKVSCPQIADRLPDVLQTFYPSYEGSSLRWEVEIYQYQETSHDDCHKNNDGSKTCHRTYSYSAGWHDHAIDSNGFHSSYYTNYRNGDLTQLPGNIRDGSEHAPDHSVLLLSDGGYSAYSLPQMLAQMFPERDLHPKQTSVGASEWMGQGELDSSMLRSDGSRLVTYQGSPRIGDVRISVYGRTGTEASVAAKQVAFAGGRSGKYSFTHYPPQAFDFWGQTTYPLARLVDHVESRKAFIAEWKSENSATAVIIRIVLFIVMIVACNCLLQPLSVMADLLRMINCFTCGLGTLLDNAAQCVISSVACGLGCTVFLVTLAVAWILVRPTLALELLAFAVACCLGVHFLRVAGNKKTEAREAEGYVAFNEPKVAFKGRIVQPMVV